MCTLIVATGLWPSLPLLVAANRDEALDRPAETPAVRVRDGVRILAPRDLQAGGTWLGLNEHGVFIGLTNRFGRPPNKALRSRGTLVMAMLSCPTAEEAYARARDLDPEAENGFHLVMADRNQAFLAYNDGAALTAHPLAPGWHVVTERSFDAAPTAREPLIKDVLAGWPADIPDDAALKGLLSLRQPNGFDGVLVEVPAHNYGTRSSTIVRLARDGFSTFLHADGPPDAAAYVDYANEPGWDIR